MIKVEHLSFGRGRDNLIENGNCTIFPNQKVGLIGSNGSGKTTFFDLLLGKIDILQGTCTFPKGWVLAHVSQLIPNSEQTAIEFVLNGDTMYRQLHTQLEAALLAEDNNKIAWIHQELENIDAYSAPARAGALLHGLGFSQEEQLKAVNTFSGGWRVRLNLAQALIARSDCLLLDEPTNHLDISAILWLEQWLKNYQGTVVVIAHDSAFLDNVVDSILVIEHKKFNAYKGNYSQYLKQRAEQLALQQKTREKQLKKQAHLKKFIDRFKAKASKAKQAQSRVKQLERMEIVQAVRCQSAFEFHFKTLEKCPNPLLALDKVNIGYDTQQPILRNISLRLMPGDRIGILGENGAGKSTLIKLLAGDLKALSGTFTPAATLKIGYFSQHQVEQLQVASTAFQHLLDIAPKLSEQAIRDYLGGFGFSGDTVYQSVASLSGGEKARLTLALIIWQNPHLLLLDEPTNHLDIEMREALSLALQEFEGALVIISHDRELIAQTVETLYLIDNGIMTPFDGDMTEYCQWLAKKQSNKSSNKSPSKSSNKSSSPSSNNIKISQPNKNQIIKLIEKLEKEIHQLTQAVHTIENQLSDNNLYTLEKVDILENLQADFKNKKALIVEKEEAWLEASTRLAEL